MFRGKLIGVFGIALLADMGLCQTERFLDMTKLVAPRNADGSNKGSVSLSGICGDCPKRIFPLKLTLLMLDKQSYFWGETFLADIRLENIGSTPIAFPWTIDGRFAYEGKVKPASLLNLAIRPMTESARPEKADGWMELAGLYGALDDPKTFITVQRGETVRLRFASHVSPRGQKPDHFPFDLAVKVEAEFFNGPLSGYGLGSRTVSENSITVKVREKP